MPRRSVSPPMYHMGPLFLYSTYYYTYLSVPSPAPPPYLLSRTRFRLTEDDTAPRLLVLLLPTYNYTLSNPPTNNVAPRIRSTRA